MNMGNGPGCFALGVCLLCLAGTVKFSRLPVIGLGENGIALGWLLIADGLFIMLTVAAARRAQTVQRQETPVMEVEQVSETEEETYAGDGYVPRDVDAEWSAWFSAFDQHFADARRGETWPPQQIRWGGSPFGDLPGQPPRNPPPDNDDSRPAASPPEYVPPYVVEVDDDIEDWIDEQFDRVLYRNNNKEA